ncbi:MAG: ATP synthase F1 subunit gamma [Candidatus Paceibacterota bacterium]
MAGQSKTIKTRIKSVKNTKKITKAMELVSASKMRRVVARTVSARPYIEHALEIVHSIKNPSALHPLLTAPATDGKVLLLVITSDKGLCGAYNTQIIRAVSAFTATEDQQCDVVSIGKKGAMALRTSPCNIVASFEQKSCSNVIDAHVVSKYAIEAFLKGTYTRVLVAHTEYISALNQQAHITQLLPFAEGPEPVEGYDNIDKEFIFEPDPETILDVVIEKIIHTRLYGMVIESVASEESARMIAMKNASDAAGEMISDLSLMYNKIRQAGITQEISEISAGMTSTH